MYNRLASPIFSVDNEKFLKFELKHFLKCILDTNLTKLNFYDINGVYIHNLKELVQISGRTLYKF